MDETPVQAQIVTDQLQELGFDAFYDEVRETFGDDFSGLNNVFPEAQGGVEDQFKILGVAVAVSNFLEWFDFDVVEYGAWGVFGQLYAEESVNAFNYFRGTDDSDKYVAPGSGPDDGRSIESVVCDRWSGYGENRKGTLTESATANHKDSRKYTGKIEVAPDEYVKLDIVYPEDLDDDRFTVTEAVEVRFGEAPLKIAKLEDLLTEKLHTINADTNRKRDVQDVATLLYVAEKRNARTDTDRYKLDTLRNTVGEGTDTGTYKDFRRKEITNLGQMFDGVVSELKEQSPQKETRKYEPSTAYLSR